MKLISKILFITLAINLTFSKCEISDTLKFLSDSFSQIEGNIEEFLEETKSILGDIELSMSTGIIPQACKDELKSMKSVIEAITKATERDEMIFNAAKDIVNHFAGLNEKCRLPLPKINTSKWDYEKFKKHKCSIEVVTFATTAGACLNGGFFACAKALKSLISIGKCIKNIIANLQ